MRKSIIGNQNDTPPVDTKLHYHLNKYTHTTLIILHFMKIKKTQIREIIKKS